jgi:hypothetical protein
LYLPEQQQVVALGVHQKQEEGTVTLVILGAWIDRGERGEQG